MQQHYLLLDGAQIDNLLTIIYQNKQTANIDILYINTPFAELQEISPILVQIEENEPLHQQFIEQWQQNAGIHFIANTDVYTTGNHLRSALQAKINNQPTLFRFYDPRILSLWLETINPEEKSRFMGPITKLYLPHGQETLEYNNTTHLICMTPDTIWIELSEQQLEHLNQAKKAQINQQILSTLQADFPEKMSLLTAEQKQTLMLQSTQKAKQYGFDSPRDIYQWSMLILHKGENFPEHPSQQTYKTLLADTKKLPEFRLNALVQQLQTELSNA